MGLGEGGKNSRADSHPRLGFRGKIPKKWGISLEVLTELSFSSPGSTRKKREIPALPPGTPGHGWAKRRSGQYGNDPVGFPKFQTGLG